MSKKPSKNTQIAQLSAEVDQLRKSRLALLISSRSATRQIDEQVYESSRKIVRLQTLRHRSEIALTKLDGVLMAAGSTPGATSYVPDHKIQAIHSFIEFLVKDLHDAS